MTHLETRNSDLIQAAVSIVDAEGEYEPGDSFARIAAVNAHTSIRIDDSFGIPVEIQICFHDKAVFRAVAVSQKDFEILLNSHQEDCFNIILERGEISNPLQNWTFGD